MKNSNEWLQCWAYKPSKGRIVKSWFGQAENLKKCLPWSSSSLRLQCVSITRWKRVHNWNAAIYWIPLSLSDWHATRVAPVVSLCPPITWSQPGVIQATEPWCSRPIIDKFSTVEAWLSPRWLPEMWLLGRSRWASRFSGNVILSGRTRHVWSGKFPVKKD